MTMNVPTYAILTWIMSVREVAMAIDGTVWKSSFISDSFAPCKQLVDSKVHLP